MPGRQQSNSKTKPPRYVPKAKAVPDRYSAGWIESLDGRYALARSIRARFAAVAADLGGIEQLSYQQRSLIERALFLEAHIAQHEQALASGEEVDGGQWTASLNSLVGLWRLLGIERKQKPVSLRDLVS